VVEENYSWDEIGRRLLDVYEAALDVRKSPAVAAR
jgi:hypothetical protein